MSSKCAGNTWVRIGCVGVSSAVLAAAYGHHALAESRKRNWSKAVQIQMLSSVGLVLYGTQLRCAGNNALAARPTAPAGSLAYLRWFLVAKQIPPAMLLAGAVGFCGTVYHFVLSSTKPLGRFTPASGMTLSLAWLLWALTV